MRNGIFTRGAIMLWYAITFVLFLYVANLLVHGSIKFYKVGLSTPLVYVLPDTIYKFNFVLLLNLGFGVYLSNGRIFKWIVYSLIMVGIIFNLTFLLEYSALAI